MMAIAAPSPRLLLAALIAAATILALPSLADADEGRYRVGVNAARLRAGPGTGFDTIGWLRQGDLLTVRRRGEGWWLVEQQRSGRLGWVAARLLRPAAPGPGPVAPPPPTATGTAADTSIDTSIEGGTQPANAQRRRERALADTLDPVEFEVLWLHMKERDARVLFRKDPNDTSSFPVTVEEDGRTLRGRISVMGSFTRRFPKKSLLIRLPADQAWQGQTRIALDAMATDPSLMREWLAWRLVHDLGHPAPRVRYLRLYINGRFVGTFLHTEWLDPAVFERYGLGADGQFFHPRDQYFCGDLADPDPARLRHCWYKLSPRDRDYSPLAELARGILETPVDEFHRFVEANFDVDALLDWILLNVLTGNGDTYNKNYFLYRSTVSGKWTVVPWDYDLSFGRNWDPFLPFPGSILNDNFQYFYPPELGAPSPLKEKTLRNRYLNTRFLERLRLALGLQAGDGPLAGWFEPTRMGARVRRLHDALAEDVRHDRYLGLSAARYRQETEAIRDYARRRWAYLKTVVFGPFPWDAERAVWDPASAPPVPPLARRVTRWMDDDGAAAIIAARDYGYLLADVAWHEAAGEVQLAARSELATLPPYLPAGVDPRGCIQRSWLLTLDTPGAGRAADIDLEFLQENSRRHEKGSDVDEDRLGLWVLEEGRWRALDTWVNPVSNTLRVRGLELKPGRALRFVACNREAGS